MHSSHPTHINVSGHTLFEVLMVLMIAILILHGAWIFLLTCFELEHKKSEMSDIQHNASKVLTLLKREISQSGFIGCMRLSPQFPKLELHNQSLNLSNRIHGDNTSLTIRYIKFPGMSLIAENKNPQTLVINTSEISKKEFFVIADCFHAEMFKVDKVSVRGNKQYLHLTQPLKYSYKVFAEIGVLVCNHFSIEPTSRKQLNNAQPVFALFVTDLHHRKIELAGHIAALSFRYALLQNSALQEVEGARVQEWNKVVAVAIALTPQSQNFNKHWYAFQSIF